MRTPFNFPSVDHLIEGVHYRIVDWNFAEGAPGEACPEGEKMIFGMCRKLGGTQKDEKDFDSSKKSKQEEEAEAEAKKQGSDVKNNKPFMVNGKKMGWAVKNGKPVMVEWGSVAGEKKVGPKQPAAQQGGGGARSARSAKLAEYNRRANDPALSEQERATAKAIIDKINSGEIRI